MSRWRSFFSSPRGFLLLAAVLGVNAMLDFVLGDNVMGVLFALLAVAMCIRAWTLRGKARPAA